MMIKAGAWNNLTANEKFKLLLIYSNLKTMGKQVNLQKEMSYTEKAQS